ncbi:diaminopimelate decarboxylase [Rhodocytophaga rosea]|uniref:Diaminopimelate decarboxylase n=1 Tax=Rhodocytophaga rosea TaxID=2704465 RepID=A0A6C0GQN3_9BACT|nr:diaminopimelate decarboxylase [Rhodocytophaga rosea]QHT70371.1 diaminopimelate decarboxylase [Rhodocytophaga rosea]
MQLVNHHYQIQGLNLEDICQEFGTPLYIYDADAILEKIQSLRTAFSGLPLRLKYAAKALTNISILKLMKSQQVGIDVVSIQEARLGLMAGFAPEEIMFTPNGVSFQEMQEAIELGINIGIDNLPMLEHFGQLYADKLSCSLRLNPHIVAGGHAKIQVAHINSKFGISISQLSQILEIVNNYQIKIAGLHVHTGSDLKDADVFLQTAAILFDAAMQFKHLRFINFGGGFKVAYKKGDHTTNIHELGAKLKDAFLAFCERYGKNLEIWFEPGKFLVSEAGLLLVKTNVVKKAPTTVFVQVDSGMNHLIRPMMYDAYHDIVNISNPDGPQQEYTVVGYICETDTLGANRELNEVREGDIIAIKNAGAYGFSMSSNYNSRLRPAEVMVYKGQAKLIRKREELEDLIKNQVVADWES